MEFQPESATGATSGTSSGRSDPAMIAAVTALRSHVLRQSVPPPPVSFSSVGKVAIPDRSPLSEFVGEWTVDKSERFDFRVDASLDELQEFSTASEKEWENIYEALALAPVYYSPSAPSTEGLFSINPPNQFRRSGEPTYVHPVRVATRYGEWCSDYYCERSKDVFDPQVYTGLVFHDIKEHIRINPKTLETFGERCCAIVDDLTVRIDGRLGFEKTCEILVEKLRSVRNESLLGRALDSLDNAETLTSWWDQESAASLSKAEKLSRLKQNDLWILEKRRSICQVLDERLDARKKGGTVPNIWPLLVRAREELGEALNSAERSVREKRGALLSG